MEEITPHKLIIFKPDSTIWDIRTPNSFELLNVVSSSLLIVCLRAWKQAILTVNKIASTLFSFDE